MAHHKSAIKRIRTSADARLRNRRDRSRYRSAEKAILDMSSRAAAQSELVKAYDLFDRMVAKGVLHRNTAARHKSKLARHVAALTG